MGNNDGSTVIGDEQERGAFTRWLSKEWAASFVKPDLKYGNAIKGSVVLKSGVLTIVQGSSKIGGSVAFCGSPSEISHFEIVGSRVLGLPTLLAFHRNGAAIQIGGAAQVLGKKDPIELRNRLNTLNAKVGLRPAASPPTGGDWGSTGG